MVKASGDSVGRRRVILWRPPFFFRGGVTVPFCTILGHKTALCTILNASRTWVPRLRSPGRRRATARSTVHPSTTVPTTVSVFVVEKKITTTCLSTTHSARRHLTNTISYFVLSRTDKKGFGTWTEPWLNSLELWAHHFRFPHTSWDTGQGTKRNHRSSTCKYCLLTVKVPFWYSALCI